MIRPEPVQKGNPHKLTKNQHVFPTHSIMRFSQDGRVEVHEKKANRTLRREPDDVLFCARRLWDHHSERGFMREAETAFQRVADKILDGAHQNLSENENFLVTDFYLLWNLRQRERSEAPIYPQLPDWNHKRLITDKNTQEQFEKSGVLFWNHDRASCKTPRKTLLTPTHLVY